LETFYKGENLFIYCLVSDQFFHVKNVPYNLIKYELTEIPKLQTFK